MEKSGLFAETTKTGDHAYGSLKETYRDPDTVIILTPDGVDSALRCLDKDKLLIIYLDADRRLLLKRLKGRGDKPREILRRLAEDDARFDRMREFCTYSIQQTEKTDAAQVAALISWLAPLKGGAHDETA